MLKLSHPEKTNYEKDNEMAKSCLIADDPVRYNPHVPVPDHVKILLSSLEDYSGSICLAVQDYYPSFRLLDNF